MLGMGDIAIPRTPGVSGELFQGAFPSPEITRDCDIGNLVGAEPDGDRPRSIERATDRDKDPRIALQQGGDRARKRPENQAFAPRLRRSRISPSRTSSLVGSGAGAGL